MNNIFKNKHGFTIVELLIVVVVIAILAAVTVVSYNGITSSARDKSLLSDIESVESELGLYVSKNGGVYDSALNWNSSLGTNPHIVFKPTEGNTIIVATSGTGYCIKAYNPASKNKTVADAIKTGSCTVIWTSGSLGSSSICGVSTAGTVYCWGANSFGQLGNNSTTSSSVPVAINTAGALLGKTVTSVSVGDSHACAVASDNKAYCWGENASGQLGNNSTARTLVPVAVNTAGALSGKTIKSISAGAFHTCAVASDNKAYCWGENASGQLGNNSTTRTLVPVAVNAAGPLSAKTVMSISAGNSYTCAVANNQAYCWGSGLYGRLGNNSTTNSQLPVSVYTGGNISGKTIRSITAGDSHTCVVTSDNNGYCWGEGALGRIGNEATSDSSAPEPVYIGQALADETVIDINVGYDHSCAVANDGGVYCWGNNNNGQIGNNGGSYSAEPVVTVSPGTLNGAKATKILNNGNSLPTTCVLTDKGAIYCWGLNMNGVFGNGTSANSTSPVMTKTIDL